MTDPRESIGANFPPATLEEQIAAALLPFETEFDQRSEELGRVTITDSTSAENATALAGVFLDIKSDADKKRVEIKEPYLKGQRLIDTKFKPLAESVDTAVAKLRQKINAYNAEQNRLAEIERNRLSQIAAEAARKADEAESAGRIREAGKLTAAAEEASQAASEVVAPTTIRSGYGPTASQRKIWKSEIMDYAKVPKDIRNHESVKEAIAKVVAQRVRGGAREIAGVRIWEEADVSFRR